MDGDDVVMVLKVFEVGLLNEFGEFVLLSDVDGVFDDGDK